MIVQLLPKQTGQGKNGTWEKQDYILNQSGNLFVIKSGSTFELPAMNSTCEPKDSPLAASKKVALVRTPLNLLGR